MGRSKPRAAISWSGGKDSCAALQHALADFDVVAMLTMFDEAAERSRSHGLRPEILEAQAARLGLERFVGRCTWATYDAAFEEALGRIRRCGIGHIVFGDIVYEEHRRWAETVCARQGLTAVEPLFGCSTASLFDGWIASGAEAVIVTTRADLLGEEWLGRTLGAGMKADFDRLGVDPCGERGEYHTLVVDTPLFASPLPVFTGERVRKHGCWALDVALRQASLPAEPSHA
jgi:diphthine-ammonia ligase